jgi:hypothetical protein
MHLKVSALESKREGGVEGGRERETARRRRRGGKREEIEPELKSASRLLLTDRDSLTELRPAASALIPL